MNSHELVLKPRDILCVLINNYNLRSIFVILTDPEKDVISKTATFSTTTQIIGFICEIVDV